MTKPRNPTTRSEQRTGTTHPVLGALFHTTKPKKARGRQEKRAHIVDELGQVLASVEMVPISESLKQRAGLQETGSTGAFAAILHESLGLVVTYDANKRDRALAPGVAQIVGESQDRKAPKTFRVGLRLDKKGGDIFVQPANGEILRYLSEEIIASRSTDEGKPTGTVAERFAKLDQYVKDHPDKPVSACVLSLIPEFELFTQPRVPLPKKAPALWAKDKREGETPPDFIKRHYAPWLGKGFGHPQLRALDERLYIALHNWLRNNAMPSDLDLPTLKEQNDRLLDSLRALGIDSQDLGRISSANQRRQG